MTMRGRPLASYPPGLDAALRALREQGHSWPEIARRLGIGRRIAHRRAKELGLAVGERLNSGNMPGVAVVGGVRPQPSRFIKPCELARLGRLWRQSVTGGIN